ncbi:hypothetical protein G6L88_04405 [Rhizobium skierniewicense]|nr:hypothetical protein [Rhizobium skierniewicense]
MRHCGVADKRRFYYTSRVANGWFGPRLFLCSTRKPESIMPTTFAVHQGKVVLLEESGEAVEVKGGISAQRFEVISLFRDGPLSAGYLGDEKGVWWYHQRNRKAKFVTRDVRNFRVMDDDYGLDNTHVYLEDRVIPGADPASFTLLGNSPYFAKDRHRLYVKTGSHFFHFDGLDAGTLVANGSYVGDKHDLYHLGSSLTLSNGSKSHETVRYSLCDDHHMLLRDWFAREYSDTIGWWHPSYSFKEDGAEQIADAWYRTENAVFFKETFTSIREPRAVFNLVRGADPNTFEPLDAFHGRDAKKVFCRWRSIADVDRPSFTPLKERFGKDKAAVYFNGYRVEHAAPATFEVLQSVTPIAKDHKRVYAASYARTSWPFGYPDDILVALDDADAKSFRTFGERGVWATDSARVYLRGEHQKKMDAGSFRFLCETATNCWAMDNIGLYRSNGTLVVAGIDGASFVKLDDVWGSDGKAVFCFVSGTLQKAIDAQSFMVTDDNGGARDAAYHYRIHDGRVRKTKL